MATYADDSDELSDIREAFEYDTLNWKDIRDEAQKDMRYVAGDPWPQKDKEARDAAGRPYLAMDELGQYVNQVINDVREHKRAIKVTPQGNGANDQSAQFRANLYRQIEYRSNAQQAYTTMFENTVQRSYGYFRISPEYVSDRSLDQELRIKPIMNPDLVTIDSDVLQPDGSDMRRAFVHEQWRLKDFKKRFGQKAKIVDFTPEMKGTAVDWITDDSIMLAEYWCLETKPRKLLVFQGPQGPIGVFEDELGLPKYAGLMGKAQQIGERDVDTHTVKMQLVNGVEILEETKFKATTIPIVACFGKILYVDEGAGPKKKILSMIRLARDPYMLYCYYRTCEAELVGMTPKFPYFARRGSLLPDQLTALQKSLHEPVAVVLVEGTADAMMGQAPEFPERQPYEPPIQALEIGAESARRAIQAAMGTSFLPTQAQRRNEKSGVALKQIEDSAQVGSFHFVDHYEAAITRGGALLEDWTPHYYDAARNVTVREANEQASVVRINDPNPQNLPQGQKEPISVGSEVHDITLSTGPASSSEREASSDLADSLLQNLQMIAGIAGPQAAGKLMALGIKLKNVGPLGDEMAKIIAPDDQPNALPPQLQQQMQTAQKVIDELTAHVNELTQQIQSKQVETEAKKQIAMGQGAIDVQIERIKAETALAVKEIDAKSKTSIAEMQEQIKILQGVLGIKQTQIDAEREARLKAHESAHERGTQAADHGHALASQLIEHAHEQTMAERTHEQNQEIAAAQPSADA